MATTGISGVAVGVITAGGFLVYTGIKNVTLVDGLREIMSGKAITEGPQTKSDLSAPASTFPDLSAPVVGQGGSFPDLSAPTVGGTDKASLQSTAKTLLAANGWSSQWNSFNNIVNAESGWNITATNPSSKAYGLAQMLAPSGGLAGNKQKYVQYGGNPDTGQGQLTAMLNYIKQRYGTPDAAWAFWQRNHWY